MLTAASRCKPKCNTLKQYTLYVTNLGFGLLRQHICNFLKIIKLNRFLKMQDPLLNLIFGYPREILRRMA